MAGSKGPFTPKTRKLNNSAIVEGDIFHRSLAIEKGARFEGLSRRDDDNFIDVAHSPKLEQSKENRRLDGA
jgi:cytoskeletal protein CcmA (bactofilin family)